MKNSFLVLCLLTIAIQASCQDKKSQLSRAAEVWDTYDKYKEPIISNRFFKHADIVPLIRKHGASGQFKIAEIGQSVRGRSINELVTGKGSTKVLLWSQMHGDESTATMALFDLFNFLTAKDEFDPIRKLLLDELELHFVPMINPDGAEVWRRRNDMEVDINRDARLLVTPEAQTLMAIAKKVQPDFGFNLHDQNTLYSAGRSPKSATISFLAPAYNFEKDMNKVREKATQVILVMNDALQEKSPGNVAKYDDAFDPRCFGDTFQGMGISTILIESGGYKDDPEKQYIRKLNFHAILQSLVAIAEESYEKKDVADYNEIPENGRSLYDVLVKNVNIIKEDRKIRTNLGINRNQIKASDFRSMSYNGRIEEHGDMEQMYGYDEIDAEGMDYIPGKVKTVTQSEWLAMKPNDELALLKQGYLFIKWSDSKHAVGPVQNRLLNLSNKDTEGASTIYIGQAANFLIGRNGVPEYAVINGYKVDLNADAAPLPNVYAY